MTFFSVIIPVYNRFHLACRAIESVLLQEDSDYEIIVVDDGSTDNTPDLAHKYSGKISYIRTIHGGVSKARNRGIGLAKGDYILFLDSDDQWLPGKITAHKSFISSYPHIPIHQTEEIWVRNNRRVNPGKRHKKIQGDIFIPSLKICLISPSAVAIRHSIFSTYGLFDPDLPACEDYDLWLRLSLYERVGLIPGKFMIRYAGHKDQLSEKHWGMDRFRLYSLLKLLYNSYGDLSTEQLGEIRSEILRRSKILLDGAVKRENHLLVEALKNIIVLVESGFEEYKSFLIPGVKSALLS